MNTENDDRDLVDAFRRSFGRLVDRAAAAGQEWPPVLTAQEMTSRPVVRGWMVASITFLITVAFGLGRLVSPAASSVGADPFQVQTGTTLTPGTGHWTFLLEPSRGGYRLRRSPTA